MIDYELTKRLKEAVFPYDWNLWDAHDEELLEKDWNIYGHIYSPTLSELMDVCHKDLKCITFEYDVPLVFAYSHFGKKGAGITLDQALSYLWLALNKNKA